MDEPRFNQRPWMYLFFWILVSGVVYFWLGDGLAVIRGNRAAFLGDVILFVLGILVWLAFFAQFVLPVRIFRDRQKIFDRVLSSMFGGRGPAIFIENGCARERVGEKENRGAGVLWLDSASAAVTRSATKFEKTIGPGVHFTESGEYLAGTVDLHKQVQRLGPTEKDDVFAAEPDENAEAIKRETYREVKKRRDMVSAWTRDGIEVVPNVTVIFKIDAKPVKGEETGSRFGFDAEAVRKAITGEGINPDSQNDARRHVAWNQLPAMLAADLWREYLAKFTLQQLFEVEQSLPTEPLPPSGPVPAETQALYQPTSFVGGSALTGILHEINTQLARWADRCEFSGENAIRVRPEAAKPTDASPPGIQKEKQTALQVINHMIKARMTRATVPVLDDSGRPESGTFTSPEYQLLQERGLKIISVSVGGLRFAPAVEEQLIRQWSTTWLDNARAEHDRIDRQRSFAALDERVEAVGAYAESLSRNLLKVNPGQKNPKGALKTLLLRTRDEMVKDDRLHRRAGMEREALEDIIQWVERDGA